MHHHVASGKCRNGIIHVNIHTDTSPQIGASEQLPKPMMIIKYVMWVLYEYSVYIWLNGSLDSMCHSFTLIQWVDVTKCGQTYTLALRHNIYIFCRHELRFSLRKFHLHFAALNLYRFHCSVNIIMHEGDMFDARSDLSVESIEREQGS